MNSVESYCKYSRILASIANYDGLHTAQTKVSFQTKDFSKSLYAGTAHRLLAKRYASMQSDGHFS